MIRSAILFAAAAISQFALAFSYTLEISEPELQERVVAMMPLKHKVLFLTVTLSEPAVDLIKDSDQIGMQTHISVAGPAGLRGEGRIYLSGSVKYEPSTGEFFLHQPVIERLEVKHLPEQYIPKIKDIAQLIVSEALSRYPVYRFKDENMQHRMAKAMLKSVAIENQLLLITLGMP